MDFTSASVRLHHSQMFSDLIEDQRRSWIPIGYICCRTTTLSVKHTWITDHTHTFCLVKKAVSDLVKDILNRFTDLSQWEVSCLHIFTSLKIYWLCFWVKVTTTYYNPMALKPNLPLFCFISSVFWNQICWKALLWFLKVKLWLENVLTHQWYGPYILRTQELWINPVELWNAEDILKDPPGRLFWFDYWVPAGQNKPQQEGNNRVLFD